jgi:hypothetical protein
LSGDVCVCLKGLYSASTKQPLTTNSKVHYFEKCGIYTYLHFFVKLKSNVNFFSLACDPKIVKGAVLVE